MHGAVHKRLSLRIIRCTFHIDNRTVANCGVWLEYASKTPLEVVADLPRWMRLFWLRSQIMRLLSVHIKLHYFQNAFDSALLAWYERGIRYLFKLCFIYMYICTDACFHYLMCLKKKAHYCSVHMLNYIVGMFSKVPATNVLLAPPCWLK